MEHFEVVKNKVVEVYTVNPRIVEIAAGLTGLYVVNKLYKKWRYSQEIFIKREEITNKVILITGCDSGFGNAMALKLSIKLGYKVIATCLKKESVDKFLSNYEFIKNNSTSVVLDVTNNENIKSVKEYTIKYLDETNSIFWGLVNNAGIVIPGQFELVPKEFESMERAILFSGPLNIIRTFLPLLPGRKNYKNKTNKLNKTSNNGGRIVNISSMSAKLIGGPSGCIYGPSKAALSYFSHSLRMELSPRFGIWVTTIEPGFYLTQIFQGAVIWSNRIKKKLEENKETELMDIYGFNVKKIDKEIKEIETNSMMNPKTDDVVNCAVHALTAKYPQRQYGPGFTLFFKIFSYLPFSITEPLNNYMEQK